MTDSYGCFSAYHLVLVDGLSYQQLFMYIQRHPYWIGEDFAKEHMFRNASWIVSYQKFPVKNNLIYLVVNFVRCWWIFYDIAYSLKKLLLNFKNCDFYLKSWTKHLKNTCGGVNLTMI